MWQTSPLDDRAEAGVLNTPVAEACCVVLLVAALACAVIRPIGWLEAVVAVPAAAIAIGAGVISLADARNELAELAPVVGFLAAVLHKPETHRVQLPARQRDRQVYSMSNRAYLPIVPKGSQGG